MFLFNAILLISFVMTMTGNDEFTQTKYDRTLHWRHNGPNSVWHHQPHDCLFNRLFRHRSKETLKLRVTGYCAGNSTGTGEFPAQMASIAENVSIWWRHHGKYKEYVYVISKNNLFFRHIITAIQATDQSIAFHLPSECYSSSPFQSWFIIRLTMIYTSSNLFIAQMPFRTTSRFLIQEVNKCLCVEKYESET